MKSFPNTKGQRTLFGAKAEIKGEEEDRAEIEGEKKEKKKEEKKGKNQFLKMGSLALSVAPTY